MPLDAALATVVIDGPIAGAASEALLRGCDSVLGQHHCLPRSEAELDGRGNWTAEVRHVDDAGYVVRITLYRGSKDQSPVLERTIVYGVRDLPEQRDRATGIVIAAGIVSALNDSESPEPPKATAEPPKTAPATPEPKARPVARPTSAKPRSMSPRARPALHFDTTVLAAVEQGLRRAEPLVGGRLSLGVALDSLFLRTFASLRFAYAKSDYTLQRLGGEFGLALANPRASWFEPRVSFVAVRNHFTAEDGATGRAESLATYRYGAVVGLDVNVPVAPQWSVIFGAESTLLRPSYDLAVGGKAQGSEGFFGYGAALGVRFRVR